MSSIRVGRIALRFSLRRQMKRLYQLMGCLSLQCVIWNEPRDSEIACDIVKYLVECRGRAGSRDTRVGSASSSVIREEVLRRGRDLLHRLAWGNCWTGVR